MSDERSARAGVDVGGTFTDVVLSAPGTPPRAVKVPTTPANQADGVADGIAEAGIDADGAALALLAHGTTTATNAVLERDVAHTVLVTTDGFADVLAIGRQNRPALYDLSVTRPEHLVAPGDVVTVAERMSPDGEVVRELTDDEVERVVAAVRERDPGAVAVSLLFAYADDRHERRLADALADLGVPVTISSRLLPEFREYERASTVVLNAAVQPVMQRYLSNLDDRVPDATVTVMTSGGGTAGLERVADAPVLTLLSGPAAGVVAAGAAATSAGYADAVAFDMGGTSSDVCLIRGGRPQVTNRSVIDGLPFLTPAVDIHTVGAGGGSIASVDRGGALQVGPRSAGARPGPACYGHGGEEPTVTDAHCALGHLEPDRELGGGLQLDVDLARAAIARLPDDAGGAAGILTVVRATMVRALRRVTTEQGVDPSGLALVAYGGAGPLHATALGRELGCAAVVIPPAAGVLSALGLLLARPRFEATRTVMRPADDPELPGMWDELAEQARAELAEQGVREGVEVTRIADARYTGQSHELRLEIASDDDIAVRLHDAHREAYGYAMLDEPVRVVTIRAVAEGPPSLDALPSDWDMGDAAGPRTRTIAVAGEEPGTAEEVEATVVTRAGLSPGDEVAGPALVEQPDTTTLLAPGETATIDEHANLVVRLP